MEMNRKINATTENLTKALVAQYLLSSSGLRGLGKSFQDRCQEIHGIAIDFELLDSYGFTDLLSIVDKIRGTGPEVRLASPAGIDVHTTTKIKQESGRYASLYQPHFNLYFDALVRFRAANDHVRVRRDFIVPDNATYPSHLRGLRLGTAVASFKRYPKSCSKEQLDALIGLGVHLVVKQSL